MGNRITLIAIFGLALAWTILVVHDARLTASVKYRIAPIDSQEVYITCKEDTLLFVYTSPELIAVKCQDAKH
jgi:hypothetical protein